MEMTMIGWIWVVFTLVFICLAVLNFKESGRKVSYIEMTERPMGSGIIRAGGSELDEPLRNFVSDFNTNIDNYNNSTSRQNKIAAFGFVVAGAIALLSLLLELKIIK